MVAWDGTSELGSTRFRRATTSVLVGALTLAAAWSALGASGSAARLPPTGGNNRDASYGPLAPPWSGPPTPGNWRFLGPAPIAGELCCGSAPSSTYGNASGRITSLVTDPSNPDIVYAGSAGGGVWKSVNGGQTWVPLTDDAPSLAIGSLAIDTTGRILYAGTGEDNHAEDALSGLGILKSTDAGRTWSLIGEGFAGERIGGLAIDRTIAGGRRLFAATSSGLYLSADSGDTWTEIRAGGTTLIIQDPTNPERWWAAQSDFCDEEQGDVITSNDGGLSWSSSLTSPQKASRLGLGVGSGGIAYVAMASCGIGEPPSGNLIYVGRTADYGASWMPIPLSTPGLQNYFRDDNARGQGYYNNVVAVDPTDANRAVFGGVTILATHDGGYSFVDVGRVYRGGSIHPDIHAAVFSGLNLLYVGTDGGVWKTATLGGSGEAGDWTNLNRDLATVQFYQGTALDDEHFLGGTQDNGSVGTLAGSTGTTWKEYYLSDGGYTAVAPGSTTVYVESPLFSANRTYFQIFRGDARQGPSSFVPAGPCNDIRRDPACLDAHADFTVPFVLDPTRPERLLVGTDRVYQSLSGGLPAGPKGWSAISGRLTTGLPGDSIAVIKLGPPGQPNMIVTASALGAVFLTRDGGHRWTNITGNLPSAIGEADRHLVPPIPWVSSIATANDDANQIWLGLGATGVPHVWHTTLPAAGPVTWQAVDQGAIPSNMPVTSVAVDPGNGSHLFVGTINGVLLRSPAGTTGNGAVWKRLGTGLPNVWVFSLSITADGSALVAWTHGRGAWLFRLADIVER